MADTPPGNRPPIELEVEVDGTPEEVWAAIATGPGITSWYVHHEVEEREGGKAWASFGPGMDVDGRVAHWDPPQRVVFDGGDPAEGLAFEWLVRAESDSTCIVRLVNSGFLEGEEWTDYYDAMEEGWRMFLANLQLHCTHFRGQHATPSLPLGSWDGPRDDAWQRMTAALGLPRNPSAGEHIRVSGEGLPELAGTVVEARPHRLSLLVDSPAPGTAFIAAEGRGETVEVSIWSYLYGDGGKQAVERDEPIWRAWLADRS